MIQEQADVREIGDWNFPLEADIENHVTTDHEHVGKNAVITPYANEILKDDHGKEVKITGVIKKFGQIVGYRAKLNGNTIYAPKKDFHVDNNYVEDIHADSAKTQKVRRTLKHWQTQHDYYGPSWDGIEMFHFELAKTTTGAAIESAGWYKYDSSIRPDMDGKDWRLVIPDSAGCVSVNCHSLLHDDVWTLNTTIYSTREIDKSKLNLIGADDHWQRTFTWSIRVAEVLETSGYDYTEPIQNFKTRKRLSKEVGEKGRQEVLPKVMEVYQEHVGKEIQWLPYVSFGISENPLPPGKVGHNRNKTDVVDYNIITMHPEALRRGPKYLEYVLKHELLHYVLASVDNPSHGEQFVKLGEKLGIPNKYLD